MLHREHRRAVSVPVPERANNGLVLFNVTHDFFA